MYMQPGNLFFLIGAARSGKSTICNKWINYDYNIQDGLLIQYTYTARVNKMMANIIRPRVVVCADDIRMSLGHRYNSAMEQFVHAIKITMIKSLLSRGHDVLVDGTHTTEQSIKQLFEIDPSAQYGMVPTSKEECYTRAKVTNQEDLYPVIDRMFDNLRNLGTENIELIRSSVKAEGYKRQIV